ncbi:MAG: cytochrome c maturation protein CcmE [Chlorobiota bacterium]|nr:cytochrome c maturation protein CcmE [Chlorobiota bacterium]QQS67712.1 MAG: cytochrome c maturation protein CcmE [Chlorobiota bacterium]
MRVKYLIGIVSTILLVVIALVAVENKKIDYMDFSTAEKNGSRAQVAGKWVKDKGCKYYSENNTFVFNMIDNSGKELEVVLNGAKPNNFELSQSVVATGEVENGKFKCSNVLTKCPSKYEADKFSTE